MKKDSFSILIDMSKKSIDKSALVKFNPFFFRFVNSFACRLQCPAANKRFFSQTGALSAEFDDALLRTNML